jgi:hypothetical protein
MYGSMAGENEKPVSKDGNLPKASPDKSNKVDPDSGDGLSKYVLNPNRKKEYSSENIRKLLPTMGKCISLDECDSASHSFEYFI